MDEKPEIYEVISRYLELKPKGREYVGLCPFHDDRNPSMTVVIDRQFYKCFACGAAGDVYSFLMDYHKCSFAEAKRIGNGGVPGSDAAPVQRVVPKPSPEKKIDPIEADKIASDNHARAKLEPPGLRSVSQGLGVSLKALHLLRVGKHENGVWSWPMRDSMANIIGIRLRGDDGKKWSYEGSRGGLFMPKPFPAQIFGPLVIVEGPTDTAAAIDLGFIPVGRQNNNSGNELIMELIARLIVTEVWVISDRDPQGIAGAEKLANDIVDKKRVKVITPTKHKDLRQALREGVTRDHVLKWAKNTTLWKKIDLDAEKSRV